MAHRPTRADPTADDEPRPGRPLGFDRDQAVDALTRTFWQHGWASTSTPVLEAATGLARSSLANTFGTKQNMLATSLAHYNAQIAEHLIATLDDDTVPGQDALHGFFDSLAMLKTDAPGSHGCLVINTLVELPERADVIDDQISRYEDMLLTGFTAALLRTTAASHHELQNLAHTLLALAMTINLHARNHDSTKVTATTTAAHALIDSWT